MGTLETGKTMGRGVAGSSIYINIPTYLSQKDRDRAVQLNENKPLPNIGGNIKIGATDFLDAGLQFEMYGLGPFLKIGILQKKIHYRFAHRRYRSPIDAAIMPYLYYTFNGDCLTGGGMALLSFDLSDYATMGMGGKIFYAPDFYSLPHKSDPIKYPLSLKIFKEAFFDMVIYFEGAQGLYGADRTGIGFSFSYPLQADFRTVNMSMGLTGGPRATLSLLSALLGSL